MKSINKAYNISTIRSKLIFVLIIELLCIYQVNSQTSTGFGNITINTTATDPTKGKWTTVGTVSTFVPLLNGSNVSVSDIQSYLTNGDVIISTSCTKCAESGTISVTSGITYSQIGLPKSFNLNANSNIYISSIINFSTNSSGKTGQKTVSINLTSNNGDIISKGLINTNNTSGEDRSECGNVFLKSQNGSVQVNSDINTSTKSTNNGSFCIGGNLEIYGKNGVTINANINCTSEKSGYLTITDNNSTLSATDFTNQGQISGTIKVASFEKSGTGIFQLKGANVWTGNTTISGGSLSLGLDNAVPTSSNLVFNGGDYKPNGYNTTVKTITLSGSNSSTVTFDAAQSSTFTFDSLIDNTTQAGTYLTIKGWQGFSQAIALTKNGALASKSISNDFVTTNGALQKVTNPSGITQYGQILTTAIGGSGGLKGKLFTTTITATGSSRIKNLIQFFNSTDNKYYQSQIISTKEIIPVNP